MHKNYISLNGTLHVKLFQLISVAFLGVCDISICSKAHICARTHTHKDIKSTQAGMQSHLPAQTTSGAS